MHGVQCRLATPPSSISLATCAIADFGFHDMAYTVQQFSPYQQPTAPVTHPVRSGASSCVATYPLTECAVGAAKLSSLPLLGRRYPPQKGQKDFSGAKGSHSPHPLSEYEGAPKDAAINVLQTIATAKELGYLYRLTITISATVAPSTQHKVTPRERPR